MRARIVTIPVVLAGVKELQALEVARNAYYRDSQMPPRMPLNHPDVFGSPWTPTDQDRDEASNTYHIGATERYFET